MSDWHEKHVLALLEAAYFIASSDVALRMAPALEHIQRAIRAVNSVGRVADS